MICIASNLGYAGGWSTHARGLAWALGRYEHTRLLDFDDLTRGTPTAALRLRRLARSSDAVGITLGAIERTAALPTAHRVCLAVTETTRIPKPLRLHLSRADMIWTPSRWGRELLEANGLPAERIRIVPAGVDTEQFRPPAASSPDPVFRFLAVGKWEERKGLAELVRAFAAEFDPAEPVELVLHCGVAWRRDLDVRAAIGSVLSSSAADGARVLASEPCAEADYVALLKRCDAFVLPTRAEAWGLPILEAMACGLPCIVTDYSGLREYANESNAYLIRVLAMERVADPEFFYKAYDWGMWAMPDPTHLRSLMRYVVENPEAAKMLGLRARRDAERCWTWDAAARTALRYIAELRSGRAGARGVLPEGAR